MSISPDIVCERYADKRIKITVRPLPNAEDMILIEGEPLGLEFLGNLLLAQAHYAKDCGFQLSPRGAGKALLSGSSTRGLYIHCVHPAPAIKAKPNGKPRRATKRRTTGRAAAKEKAEPSRENVPGS